MLVDQWISKAGNLIGCNVFHGSTEPKVTGSCCTWLVRRGENPGIAGVVVKGAQISMNESTEISEYGICAIFSILPGQRGNGSY